ncbi:MAG: hypothetical protein LBQ38_11645, partial [Spirochaetaceae bacterium]|nr:hypothetical protein [Spirochaetaceae bacterium]
MTDWEKGIVDLFLARYPGSAAAGLGGDPPDPAAGPSPGKVLRIGLDRLFPGFETAPPDARESFLEAAESLEKRGLVFIRWIRRRKGEALSALVCPDPEALFVFAGKPSPAAAAEAARETARGIARTAPNQGVESLFAFLAESISAEDALRGINAVAVGDLYSLIRSLPDAPSPPRGITPRALSVSLYGDSKRLEEILRLFGRILSRAERRG